MFKQSVSWFPRLKSCYGSVLAFQSSRSYCEKKKSMIPDLKEIRHQTGAGIMECKRVYEKHGMDKDKAIAELMEIARSSKGRGRATSAGWIAMKCQENRGVVCELLSETDFVSNNEKFRKLTASIAASALHIPSVGNESVFTIETEEISKQASLDNPDVTVSQKISELIYSMGETMKLNRCEGLRVKEGGIVDGYVHGGRIGVLVGLTGGSPSKELAKDLAIHIAACAPEYISSDLVPEGKTVKESDILMEQDYIHDESIKVKDELAKHGTPNVVMHILRR